MISSEKVSTINNVKLPYEEPKTYEQAWNHQDPVQRKKWREAIVKERGDMETRVVWKRVKRSNIPSNKRCVKCKWVFKIKRDGTFRARLVACGCSQIPGVDFFRKLFSSGARYYSQTVIRDYDYAGTNRKDC